MSSTRIPFGERGGRLVTVDEVRQGVECGCVCPACGSRLVARKGAQKVHHFAHLHDADEASCARAAETALHRMAKQLVAEADAFPVPEFVVDVRAEVDGHGGLGYATACRAGRLLVEEAKLEQFDRATGLRPDVRISGRIEGTEVVRELWIEVAVNHAIDETKRQQLSEAGIRCVELDLADWDPMVGREPLEKLITQSAQRRQWISHPQEPEARRKAQERAEANAAQRARKAVEEHERENRRRARQQAADDRRKTREKAVVETIVEVFENVESVRLPELTTIVEIRGVSGDWPGKASIPIQVFPTHDWAIERSYRPWRPNNPVIDVRLVGQDGEIEVVILAHGYEWAPPRKKNLSDSDVPVLIFDARILQKRQLHISRDVLLREIVAWTRLKRWRHHPAEIQAQRDEAAKIAREQQRALVGKSGTERGNKSGVSWLEQAVVHAGAPRQPRTRREFLLQSGAIRTPDGGMIHPLTLSTEEMAERGWLVCTACGGSLEIRELLRWQHALHCRECGDAGMLRRPIYRHQSTPPLSDS